MEADCEHSENDFEFDALCDDGMNMLGQEAFQ
jgi:hypothetical protein